MKKYFKFIFEVIAIVLGITLSFVVDEWREKRQFREETLKVLKFIQSDLKQDSSKLADLVALNPKFFKTFLDNPDEATDTIRVQVTTLGVGSPPLVDITKSGYITLTTKRSIVMKNDSLLPLISSYYNDHEYDRTTENFRASSRNLWNYVNKKFKSFYKISAYSNSKLKFEDLAAIPDYLKHTREVTNQPEFRNLLFDKYVGFEINLKPESKHLMEEIGKINRLIEIELND